MTPSIITPLNPDFEPEDFTWLEYIGGLDLDNLMTFIPVPVSLN